MVTVHLSCTTLPHSRKGVITDQLSGVDDVCEHPEIGFSFFSMYSNFVNPFHPFEDRLT